MDVPVTIEMDTDSPAAAARAISRQVADHGPVDFQIKTPAMRLGFNATSGYSRAMWNVSMGPRANGIVAQNQVTQPMLEDPAAVPAVLKHLARSLEQSCTQALMALGAFAHAPDPEADSDG